MVRVARSMLRYNADPEKYYGPQAALEYDT
jgi:hypothetical protein